MQIVVAIDSFKGSLSSIEAGNAVKRAILQVNNEANVVVKPLADGGEGTVAAFLEGLNAKKEKVVVSGPLSEQVNAEYCILQDSNTAVIEMASAAGITLIGQNVLNPLKTTTYGVGEIIKHAINKGCRHFIIGIGGSATNDGGVGMLSALGFEFKDKYGKEIPLGAQGLENLAEISDKNVIPALKDCTFRIACDVSNPLCGSDGCSAVFGPQKGATPEMIDKMDEWLLKYARLSKQVFEKADADFPGAGAAGGLGFAFLTFTNAVLERGIDIVIEETALEQEIKKADIVVTGEGKMDGQTVMGKAPIGVAKLAKKYDKKVIAFAGVVTDDSRVCNEHGIDAFFPILRKITSLDEALDKESAYSNLVETAYQVFRLIK